MTLNRALELLKMQTKEVQLVSLKSLRKKAELCRFCHSELKGRYVTLRNWKEFFIVLLSLLISALTSIYYRNILSGELVLILILFLPLLIALLQALDHTVFHWTNKIALHQAAVGTWGDWIREAATFESQIDQYPVDTAYERTEYVEEKYRNCMEKTVQIPNKSFLRYKRKFSSYVLRSRSIDGMSLDDFKLWNRIWSITKRRQ